MRYLTIALAVCILSTVCNSQSSPNTPGPNTTVTANTHNANPAAVSAPAAIATQSKPSPQTQSTMTIDEAVRIARAELERDSYKQAWQESHESVKNVEWTVDKAMWAIGIAFAVLLGTLAIVVFKNKGEYKEAVDEARTASKEARDILKDVRTQADAELDRIRKQGEQIEKQNKANLDEIKKQIEHIKDEGNKKIRDLTDEATSEQKSSELWSEALRLHNKGSYEDVFAKCAEIINLKPNNYLAYNLWGIALIDLGRAKEDGKLFEEACRKFEQAIKLKPDMYNAYDGWGIALIDLGRAKEDEKFFEEACHKFEQAIKLNPNKYDAYLSLGIALIDLGTIKKDGKLFEEACRKLEQAVTIKSDDPLSYSFWGIAIGSLAKIKTGTPEYGTMLKQAEEICFKAEALKKGSAAYSLARICALNGDKAGCKKWLELGQETRTLPRRNRAMKCSDLASVFNEDWFKKLKWKYEK